MPDGINSTGKDFLEDDHYDEIIVFCCVRVKGTSD